MMIDFERAEVVDSRPVLGDICVNRKRKRQDEAVHKQVRSTHIIEGGRLKTELQALVKKSTAHCIV
jgi:hypothetical protein